MSSALGQAQVYACSKCHGFNFVYEQRRQGKFPDELLEQKMRPHLETLELLSLPRQAQAVGRCKSPVALAPAAISRRWAMTE